MLRAPAILLLAVCVSGCLDGSTPLGGADERPAPAFALACVNGSGAVPDCAARIPASGPAELQGEPFLAIDPSNPDRIALGLISAKGATGAHASKLRFLVSEDGGQSWHDLSAPEVLIEDAVPLRLRSDADPALAFDQQGTLHIVGLATRVGTIDGGVTGRASRVYHAATADLGETWIGPIVLGDGIDNDRPWIATGQTTPATVVTWQTTSGSRDMHAAWTTDQGVSWTSSTVRASCNLVSPPIVEATGFLVACHDRSGGAPCELPILDVTFSDRTIATRGCAPGPVCGTNLLTRLGDDGLAWGCLSGWMSASSDGGRSWAPAVNLLSRISLDDEGQGLFIFAMSADPAGYVHVLVANYAVAALPAVPLGGGYLAGHIALSTSDWEPVSETRLTRPDTVGPLTDFKGEFAGLGFSGDRGLAAWVDREHHVRVLALESAPAAASKQASG